MQGKKCKIIPLLTLVSILFAAALSFLVPAALAHCDTMDGPVIQAAKKALETGKVDLVLIWVKEKDEEQLKNYFQETLAARIGDPTAKEAADNSFFEALVRMHREGEGETYSGLKTEAVDVAPGIKAADEAVETGSVYTLLQESSEAVRAGIEARFERVMEKKKHMNEGVAAGRGFVQAYVEFIHYVEKLYQGIEGSAGGHAGNE